MVKKLKDGRHLMVSTPKEIFDVFVFKVIRFRKYQAHVRWPRVLVFSSTEDAARCYEEMRDAEGIDLSLIGRKIKVHIPQPLIELVD